jgi:hypothetical protein
MSTLVHSIRRRALVVGLVVASLAGASGSAYAASAAAQLSDGPLPTKITGVVDGSLYGYANSYTPAPKFHAVRGVVDGSLYGYANSYTPTPKFHAVRGVVDGSLYGYANSYTPTPTFHKVPKIPQRPKVVVERTVVRCDVPVGTAHAGDLWRCE